MPLQDFASRRYFRPIQQGGATEELESTLIPRRADHYVNLVGYHLEPVIDSITFSTTATWLIDIVLVPVQQDWGDWSLDNGLPGVDAPPLTQLIDSWRVDGGVGRVVTEGGYLIPRHFTNPVTYCDIAVPSVHLSARRLEGLTQTYGIQGWLDYRWVKGSPAEMAAVNLAWSIQGVPLT